MQRSRLLRFTVGALMLATGVGFGTSGVGFAALAHGAVTPDTVPAPTDPATIPGYDSDPLSLLGPSRIAPELMAAFVESHGPRTTVPIAELANIYAQEGAALGVRADLAWTQSIIETGFFHFPDSGMVHPQDNNFAGIGACDSCHNGTGYPDARLGVRAQMQLLRGYADPNPPSGMMIYPPKSYRGSAPTWWQMGNGHWATSTRYAGSITAMYGSLLRSVGIDLAFRPATPIVGDASVNGNVMPLPVDVPVREGDGLYLADVHGQVYDTGDARFWGAAPIDASGCATPGGAIVDATTPTARTTTAASGSFEPPTAGVLAIAMTPNANGYWVVSTGGAVNHFGDAPQFGHAPAATIALAALPRGYGYWTTDGHGHVRSFGAAPKLDPVAGSIASEARIVAIATTQTGNGYWLIDSHGRVVAVGDAQSFGDATNITASDPVVGIAPTTVDDGYWIATASGSVQSLGAARDHGSLADDFTDRASRIDFPLEAQRMYAGLVEAGNHLVIGIGAAPSGDGYWLTTADGLVAGRGTAPDFAAPDTQGVPILAVTSRR